MPDFITKNPAATFMDEYVARQRQEREYARQDQERQRKEAIDEAIRRGMTGQSAPASRQSLFLPDGRGGLTPSAPVADAMQQGFAGPAKQPTLAEQRRAIIGNLAAVPGGGIMAYEQSVLAAQDEDKIAKQVFDDLEAGNIDAARYRAQRAGMEIPAQVLRSRENAARFARAVKMADSLYADPAQKMLATQRLYAGDEPDQVMATIGAPKKTDKELPTTIEGAATRAIMSGDEDMARRYMALKQKPYDAKSQEAVSAAAEAYLGVDPEAPEMSLSPDEMSTFLAKAIELDKQLDNPELAVQRAAQELGLVRGTKGEDKWFFEKGPDIEPVKARLGGAPPISGASQAPKLDTDARDMAVEGAGLPVVRNKAEKDALPSGTIFIGPNGNIYRKD